MARSSVDVGWIHVHNALVGRVLPPARDEISVSRHGCAGYDLHGFFVWPE